MGQTFIIHKTQKTVKKTKTVWALESQNGDAADNAEFTSRPKALMNFCRKHPSDEYKVILPNQEVYTLRNDGVNWLIVPADTVDKVSTHTSLRKALTALQGNYLSHIEEFQIVIPNKDTK